MKTEIDAWPAVRIVETPSEKEDAVGGREKQLLLKIFMSNKKFFFSVCIVPLYSISKNV